MLYGALLAHCWIGLAVMNSNASLATAAIGSQGALESRRRIHPKNSRSNLADITISVRRLARKMKRISSLDQVALSTQDQFNAALQNKANFFPNMLDQAVARLAWRNDVNIGL